MAEMLLDIKTENQKGEYTITLENNQAKALLRLFDSSDVIEMRIKGKEITAIFSVKPVE